MERRQIHKNNGFLFFRKPLKVEPDTDNGYGLTQVKRMTLNEIVFVH